MVLIPNARHTVVFQSFKGNLDGISLEIPPINLGWLRNRRENASSAIFRISRGHPPRVPQPVPRFIRFVLIV